jgi:hypothetical protein
MNQPATQIGHERNAARRSVGEQLVLNRNIVAVAEDHRLLDAIHPTRWERRGLFRRLRQRPGLAEVA